MTLCPWLNHCSNMGITKKLVAFIKRLSILLLITRKGDRVHSSFNSQQSKFGKSMIAFNVNREQATKIAVVAKCDKKS